ncbi:GDSL-type esterase/lipase family protein [Flavobacterium cellulosilyticum]|uniref:G-D-S-L family lipolytic protein n=1 Tax=Flavobacterium cellulosilyticum TaxID=2541731 RepID=A0A4R5CEB5_9FLAO|nr:GDSL-type esterase/lipase family protein [Flavobacterium cellulosilyticum]TDD95522.1 G-D-S-L family lipolytic protein [Flavobacterium cellulosilyticum]
MNIKVRILFLLLLFSFVGCKVKDKPYWEDIQKFKTIDQQNSPIQQRILFIGSSSFTYWKDVQEYFPNHSITNRAFGGSTLLNLIEYKNDILNPYHPKQIVIYCGENDIANDDKVTGETVYNRFLVLFEIIKHKYPDVFVAYVSMKPSPSRWHLKDKMMDGNRRIETFLKSEKNTVFINIWDKMLDEKGKPMGIIFLKDSLHMNPKGYEIWKKEIAPNLKF